MSLLKRLLALGTAAGVCWFATAIPVAADDAKPITIDIAAINDLHGRVVRDGQAGGTAVLGCALTKMRTANPNSVFVAAGDLIGGSVFESAVAADVPTIKAMNLLDLEVSAVGNHEFDRGVDDFDKRVIPASSWDYISANLFLGGKPAYPQYSISEIAGVRVAFIGATTEELSSLTSSGDIQAADMTDSVNKVVGALSDGDAANGEADVYIVLVHDGAGTEDLSSAAGTPYGKLIKNIDPKVSAILSGHTHKLYAEQVNGVWVMQSAQYGEQLGRLTLSYDPATKTAAVLKAWNEDLVDASKQPTCTDLDPKLTQFEADVVADAKVLGKKPVGSVAGDFLRAVGGEDRGHESTLGNFVADVHLWAAKSAGAQVALMNPGGLRADLLVASADDEGDGVVTFREASSVQPFANTLMLRSLTGAQLKKVLEQQWQPQGSSRPMLKLGISKNLRYTFDPNADPGNRVTTIELDGKPLRPDDTIRVVANSFLMERGGDNFLALTEGTGLIDTGWVDLDATVAYFKRNSPAGAAEPVKPDMVQRSFGVTFHTPADRVSVPGEEVSLDLYGLSFTNGEPKPTKVTASIGGLVLGTFAVDTTLDPLWDKTGKAMVRISLPADLASKVVPGEDASQLVLSDDINGKLLSLPVKVAPKASPTPTVAPSASPGVSVSPTAPPSAPPGPGKRPLPKTGDADSFGVMLLGLALVAGAVVARRKVK